MKRGFSSFAQILCSTRVHNPYVSGPITKLTLKSTSHQKLLVKARFLSTLRPQVKCWKCQGEHSSEMFCPHCNVIQQNSDDNYFSLLNVEAKYSIDSAGVKKCYLSLQTLLHPDKFATSSQTEQDFSSSHSTLVNEAYKTLIDPLKRGLYLLELNGHILDSETVEGGEEGLLNNIFLLNFQVEESEDSVELKEILTEVEESIGDEIESANNHFDEHEFLLAKQAIIKLKYYFNIKATIEDKLLDLSL